MRENTYVELNNNRQCISFPDRLSDISMGKTMYN